MSNQQRGIIPQKIKGFRDIDPHLYQLKETIVNAASTVYKRYGFEHWDTPVLEYADALGKYMPDVEAVDQGVYSFRSPEVEPVYDTEGRELKDEEGRTIMENHFLAMRYDLTAPLARRYAESIWAEFKRGQIKEGRAPLFRRFQYGPVFRYELKLAPGRFREFWQIDFDTVGASDVTVDAECTMILADALQAIGMKTGTYLVKVNNRKILKGLLASLGVDSAELEADILRVVDKYDKIGIDNVRLELGAGRKEASGSPIPGLGLSDTLADGVCDFLQQFITDDPRNLPPRKEVLARMVIDHPIAREGLEELRLIDEMLAQLGYDEQRIVFDPTFVRGMAYYTGPIFEVEALMEVKDKKGHKKRVGSIGGGGRYDSLVKNLLGIEVPAVGASIGVDRLAALLEMADAMPEPHDGPVLIVYFDDELRLEYQQMAYELRQAGIQAEVYCGTNKNLKKQLKYADNKRSPIAIMVGSNEAKAGIVSVRNLKLGAQLADTVTDKKEWQERVQSEVKREDLVATIQSLLKV